MEAIENKVENQVQFWSLLGPFFVLLSIAILLFKVSPHWYFSVSALIGIPLCVKWKMKGLAASLGCLFLLSGIHYQTLELDDRYWHVGLSMAMAFSFIVLTLSLEEGLSIIQKMKLESQSRLDNFLLLGEKWKAAEFAWGVEKEQTKTEIVSLSHELSVIVEDKQTFYKLAQLTNDELILIRKQHESLVQDLSYKKQQISQYHERLEEADITIQEFVNSDSEKRVQFLTKEIANLELERETFKAKIALLTQERQECQLDKDQLLSEKRIYQDSENSLQDRFDQEKKKREELETINQEVRDRLEKKADALEKINQEIRDRFEVLEKKADALEKKAIERERIYQTEVQRLQAELSSQIQREQVIEQQLLEMKKREEREKEKIKEEKVEEEKVEEEKVPYMHGRRIESMFIQLKQQFEEKCEVLNQTRQELFKVNEELLKYQKNYEEEHVYDLYPTEVQLQKHLNYFSHQFDQMKALYQQEIDELNNLIGVLLKR